MLAFVVSVANALDVCVKVPLPASSAEEPAFRALMHGTGPTKINYARALVTCEQNVAKAKKEVGLRKDRKPGLKRVGDTYLKPKSSG